MTLEAKLQREVRDIVDELDIMLNIANQQQEMIGRFVRFAEANVRKFSPKDRIPGTGVGPATGTKSAQPAKERVQGTCQ